MASKWIFLADEAVVTNSECLEKVIYGMNESVDEAVWTPISALPRPWDAKMCAIVTAIVVFARLFGGLHGFVEAFITALVGSGLYYVLNLDYKSKLKRSLLIETNGRLLRIWSSGIWMDVKEIGSLKMVRQKDYHLVGRFVLANENAIEGNIYPTSRYHIPFKGAKDFLTMMEPVLVQYGFGMQER